MSFDLTIHDFPHFTYKDYEKWEGDWEFIRGIPYAMSTKMAAPEFWSNIYPIF